MHQVYFERKMSQPSTSSRSMTPKPFSRASDDLGRSPDRITSDFSQLGNHSPSVNGPRSFNHTNSSLGSSAKAINKMKDQVLNSDRQRNRTQQVYLYNAKNGFNVQPEMVRTKSSRNPNIVTKTEPNNDIEVSYTGQINKLLQKLNKMKFDLSQSQEREAQYLNKLSNLEKENKSLQLVIEDKEKRMQDISSKSKDDKLRMYHFLTELEAYKQNSTEAQSRDDVSTVRLSEFCESTKRMDKSLQLEKGVQTTELNERKDECVKCLNISSYCEMLLAKLSEVDQASKYILKENNAMKESLIKAKKSEGDYIKARSEIEKKAVEIQNDYDRQAQIYNEVVAENIAVRKVLVNVSDNNGPTPQETLDAKRNKSVKVQKESIQYKLGPLPASLKALVAAEKTLNMGN